MSYSDEQLESQVKATVNAWASEGTLSEAKLHALLRPVRRHRRIRSLLTALTTAAASLLLLLTIPQVRVWAAQKAARLPVIVEFIRRMAIHDPMWTWAQQHDAFQEIIAEARDQGYTVRLHQVLADPTQTTVIFTIEGGPPLPASADLQNLGVMLMADGRPIGNSYRMRPEVVDGVLVVALETGALPTEQAHLTLNLFQVLGTKGHWQLAAQVSRKPLSALARTVAINKDLKMGDVTLRVDQVVISPTQTVVEATGPDSGVDLFGSGFSPELLADGALMTHRGANGTGGGGPIHYTFDFAPLPKDAKALTLQINGYLMQASVETVVPLTPGAVVQTAGGWELRVDSYHHDPNANTEVVLSYPHDQEDPWRPYDNWTWVDQTGTAHPFQPTLICKATDPRCTLRFSVLPQEARAPVRLQADTAWIKVQGPWQIHLIDTP